MKPYPPKMSIAWDETRSATSEEKYFAIAASFMKGSPASLSRAELYVIVRAASTSSAISAS